MQLRLIQRSQNEIITLKEAKDYLRVSHDFDDELISLLIQSTRASIETIIQKSIMKQTWSYVLRRDEFCNANSDGRPYVIGSIIKIPLPRSPALNILQVFFDEREIDRRKIHLEKMNNLSCAIIEDIKNFDKSREITINYEAGLASSRQEIPAQIKLANLIMIANAYQNRQMEAGQLATGVSELLKPFLDLRIF